MNYGKVLIDGDIVAYRSAFASQQDGEQDAKNKADDLVTYILESTALFPEPDDYQVYLTGKTNFRFDIAKSHVYKGNRKDAEKPRHLGAVRDHLIDNWGAVVSEDQEADDLIAIDAARQDYNACVASIDKDMLQIPCWHFNFVKGTMVKVDAFEGIKFFYTQILTGDKADNIVGLYKVGPVKAGKILDGCDDEDDLWDAVLKAYDGDVGRVVENARLLWLRRFEGEMWLPPSMR